MRQTHRNQPPQHRLAEKLHDLLQIKITRLDEQTKPVESLFDSRTYSTSSRDYSDPKNPYLLNSVFFGEIWRFRMTLTNISDHNLRNFGLLLNIETMTKGPTQLYPRPQELCPSNIDRGKEIVMDLHYPVTVNVTSTLSMVATITAATDDDQRLYKEYFQLRALPAVKLTFQKQTLEEKLFVEAHFENVTCEPQMPLNIDIDFKCMGLFKAFDLTRNKKRGSKTILNANEATTVLFQIEMVNPTSLVNLNALSVGQIEVQWRTKTRHGLFCSDVIQRRSLFCRKLNQAGSDIDILIVNCPAMSVVYCPFTVTFHIFNQERSAYRLWLAIDKNVSGFMLPINSSKKYLGIVKAHSNVVTSLDLVALAPGIHLLKGIVIVAEKVTSNPKQVAMSALEAFEHGSDSRLRSIRHTLHSMGHLQSAESLSYNSLRGIHSSTSAFTPMSFETLQLTQFSATQTRATPVTIHYESTHFICCDIPKDYKPNPVNEEAAQSLKAEQFASETAAAAVAAAHSKDLGDVKLDEEEVEEEEVYLEEEESSRVESQAIDEDSTLPPNEEESIEEQTPTDAIDSPIIDMRGMTVDLEGGAVLGSLPSEEVSDTATVLNRAEKELESAISFATAVVEDDKAPPKNLVDDLSSLGPSADESVEMSQGNDDLTQSIIFSPPPPVDTTLEPQPQPDTLETEEKKEPFLDGMETHDILEETQPKLSLSEAALDEKQDATDDDDEIMAGADIEKQHEIIEAELDDAAQLIKKLRRQSVDTNSPRPSPLHRSADHPSFGMQESLEENVFDLGTAELRDALQDDAPPIEDENMPSEVAIVSPAMASAAEITTEITEEAMIAHNNDAQMDESAENISDIE